MAPGTNGGASGTSGAGFWIAYGLIAASILGICTINALSEMREHERLGQSFPVWRPFLLEGTSAILMIALAPLVFALLQRHPLRRIRLRLDLAVHALGTLVFSLVHVAGMVALRKLVFALAGERYGFSLLPADLLYEYRKDAAAYIALVGAFWMIGRLIELERALAERRAAPPPETSAPGRLALRDGAVTVQVAIADILWVASAGNYVEVALAGGRTKLIRGTLQGFETTLTPHGFARVHRTRIVNLARIATMESKESGDVALSLDDGSQIQASRRYRDRLKLRTRD